MKSSVVQQREEDAHVYLRWVLGQQQSNAAPRQKTHRYKHTKRKDGGLNDPRKKKTLKIGPLKTRDSLKNGF